MKQETYTNQNGEIVAVDCLEWLEDDAYYEYGDDFDEDGYETGEYRSCSRYYIGVDESGDSISVWLNDDMVEVDV